MSGKLHLICMKTEVFMLKLDVIYTKFHTSVKRKKINFNSYNYNFSFIHSYSVFIIMFSLKIRFQLIVCFAHLDYDVRI